MTPTKITLSQLESFLFKSADILRDQPDLTKELPKDKAKRVTDLLEPAVV